MQEVKKENRLSVAQQSRKYRIKNKRGGKRKIGELGFQFVIGDGVIQDVFTNRASD